MTIWFWFSLLVWAFVWCLQMWMSVNSTPTSVCLGGVRTPRVPSSVIVRWVTLWRKEPLAAPVRPDPIYYHTVPVLLCQYSTVCISGACIEYSVISSALIQMLMSVRWTLTTVTHRPPVSIHRDTTAAPAGTDGLGMESDALVRVIIYHLSGIEWCVVCDNTVMWLCMLLIIMLHQTECLKPTVVIAVIYSFKEFYDFLWQMLSY